MKFTLDSSSLETFNKTGIVEIAGLYDEERVALLNREIDLILKDKGTVVDSAMKEGHDLTRVSEPLKKGLLLSTLAEIAYELIAERPLKLAYDQILVGPQRATDKFRESDFWKKTATLVESSSVNDIVLGVMIGLKAEEAPLPFPSAAGHLVFFRPDVKIPFEWLKERMYAKYLLLTLTTIHSLYVYNEGDPQNHFLKKLGYVYGDKLKNSLHPIIYR